MTGLFSGITAAHAVGNRGGNAFMNQWLADRNQRADKIFIIVFDAFVGGIADAGFKFPVLASFSDQSGGL